MRSHCVLVCAYFFCLKLNSGVHCRCVRLCMDQYTVIALWFAKDAVSFQIPALAPLLRYSNAFLLKTVTHCDILVSAKTTEQQITPQCDS